MKYKVRRQGVDLGFLPLEEVRRRRAVNEFVGNEYVQCEGSSDWQPVDLVLQQGYQATPPQIPKQVARPGLHPGIILGAVLLGVLMFGGFIYLGFRSAMNIQPRFNGNQAPARYFNNASSQAAVGASKLPIVWTTNTLTAADANRRAREFRTRQWLDGYEQRGNRNPEYDAAADQLIKTWLARNYGGDAATNKMSLAGMSAQLAADPHCNDPLVLIVAALNTPSTADSILLYQHAQAVYPGSRHRAYPQFYASLMEEAQMNKLSESSLSLDTTAREALTKCFADGSFTPADQQEIAEIFVNGWGYNFFARQPDSVCASVHVAGPEYHWLALALDGEREIIAAWAARGGGYANTVSDQGWKDFNSHLAAARKDLTEAWNLQPTWPLAPARMIYVSLGDSDIDEMRVWFDRTTTAQIDYNRAWSDFRWGLRPRWYGNEASLLAFGRQAVDTGRFDTDVPRKFIDAIYDAESEMALPAGRHIFGRDDVWPEMHKMYDGYINVQSNPQFRDGWRTAFAVAAYFAYKYDESRAQLEALDWKPQPEELNEWGVDLSAMPLEVAARTGPLAIKISAAESLMHDHDPAGALKKYQQLAGENPDPRTGQFIQLRLAQLAITQHLASGNWINFLPAQRDDPGWSFDLGQIEPQADGSVLAKSAATGHSFYSRAPVSANFEVRGRIELVSASDKNSFQAGLIFGDLSGNNWCSFRLRHSAQNDSVTFGRRWTKTEMFRVAVLNGATNTFDFILKNGCVTASVNGLKVFDQTPVPQSYLMTGDTFTLGLGALSRTNAIIRYRDVQVRSLN